MTCTVGGACYYLRQADGCHGGLELLSCPQQDILAMDDEVPPDKQFRSVQHHIGDNLCKFRPGDSSSVESLIKLS